MSHATPKNRADNRSRQDIVHLLIISVSFLWTGKSEQFGIFPAFNVKLLCIKSTGFIYYSFFIAAADFDNRLGCAHCPILNIHNRYPSPFRYRSHTVPHDKAFCFSHPLSLGPSRGACPSTPSRENLYYLTNK